MKKKGIRSGYLLLPVSVKFLQTWLKLIVSFLLILVFSIDGFSQNIHRVISEGDTPGSQSSTGNPV